VPVDCSKYFQLHSDYYWDVWKREDLLLSLPAKPKQMLELYLKLTKLWKCDPADYTGGTKVHIWLPLPCTTRIKRWLTNQMRLIYPINQSDDLLSQLRGRAVVEDKSEPPQCCKGVLCVVSCCYYTALIIFGKKARSTKLRVYCFVYTVLLLYKG
jgi:hypothetical protein